MKLDRALTDAEAPSDLLVHMAGDDQAHDLALSRRQAVDKVRFGFAPAGRLEGIPGPPHRAVDACDQFALGKRLLNKIDGADLHGLDRGLHVAASRDHHATQAMTVSRAPLWQ